MDNVVGRSQDELMYRISRAEAGEQRLDLSGLQLTELPDSLWQLTHLIDLDLSENLLTDVPEAIGRFTNLDFLNLSENRLVQRRGSSWRGALRVPGCRGRDQIGIEDSRSCRR